MKRNVFACSDLHDYGVSARLHGHTNPAYPGCSHPHAKFPPVVAYAPGVFDHTTTQDQYGHAVADLGRIAVASKHVIGWPGAPLAASWTHHSRDNTQGYGIGGKAHVIPWHYINTDVFMVYTPNNSLQELSGIWNAMFSEGEALIGLVCVLQLTAAHSMCGSTSVLLSVLSQTNGFRFRQPRVPCRLTDYPV